jgi:hypothetical protein
MYSVIKIRQEVPASTVINDIADHFMYVRRTVNLNSVKLIIILSDLEFQNSVCCIAH